MFVLAVTGGIGSGKSTAARQFAEWGAVVLDMDDMAKRLIATDGPLVDPVAAEFGDAVRNDVGGIDTARLAALAFASPQSAARLNAIVHPAALAAAAGALDMLAAQPEPPEVVVMDIPLITEAPEFFDIVDAVLAISSPEDVRIRRLKARGMAEQDAHARIACQVQDSERREVADWVIENDGTPDEFREDLETFWAGEVLPRVA